MSYWAYQSCSRCSGKAQVGSVALMKYIIQKYPYTKSLGVYSCRNVGGTGTLSIHSCGRAGDTRIPTLSNGRADTKLGYPVVRFLDYFSSELGIHGQIYDRVRYDAKSPNGRYYGGVHPHYDHIHWEQRLEKATTLDYAKIVAICGPPTPGQEDGTMLLQEGSKGPEVAEVQKILAEEFGQNNGTWAPLAGVSAFDGQPFQAGEDGSYGSTCTQNVKNAQKTMGMVQTGVVNDYTWSALVSRRYSKGTVVDLTKLATKAELTNHAKSKASSTIHPHSHDEGQTGGPI